MHQFQIVIPAKAGIQFQRCYWVAAFAGLTKFLDGGLRKTQKSPAEHPRTAGLVM
ncbi:MAG: hypothetical protein J7494_05585 [Sphingobium sp.]|nr:hypothetical protein [Sphingobium sp.]